MCFPPTPFHSTSRRGNQNQRAGMDPEKGNSAEVKEVPRLSAKGSPEVVVSQWLKRKRSRPCREGRPQKGWPQLRLRLQPELVSLSDRSAHVENCTEKHFMELLEGMERLCQRKPAHEKIKKKKKGIKATQEKTLVNYSQQ